jgi:hypothetical protein
VHHAHTVIRSETTAERITIMSGANYEYCPGCESKALYMGEYDVPDGVEVWHGKCLAADRAKQALRIYRDVNVLMADYGDPDRDIIAAVPFAASLDQVMSEQYGVTLDDAPAEGSPS